MIILPLVSLLLLLDAWSAPVESHVDSIVTVNPSPYTYLNNTGHDVSFGGPGASPYSKSYKVTCGITTTQDTLNGWSEPSYDSDYDPVGDFSYSLNATADTQNTIIVAAGDKYVHDVLLNQRIGQETFSSTVNDGQTHAAGRGKNWQSKNKDNIHIVHMGGGPAGPGA